MVLNNARQRASCCNGEIFCSHATAVCHGCADSFLRHQPRRGGSAAAWGACEQRRGSCMRAGAGEPEPPLME
jgi:hypothetical protein